MIKRKIEVVLDEPDKYHIKLNEHIGTIEKNDGKTFPYQGDRWESKINNKVVYSNYRECRADVNPVIPDQLKIRLRRMILNLVPPDKKAVEGTGMMTPKELIQKFFGLEHGIAHKENIKNYMDVKCVLSYAHIGNKLIFAIQRSKTICYTEIIYYYVLQCKTMNATDYLKTYEQIVNSKPEFLELSEELKLKIIAEMMTNGN